jgi:hypothetical protein
VDPVVCAYQTDAILVSLVPYVGSDQHPIPAEST